MLTAADRMPAFCCTKGILNHRGAASTRCAMARTESPEAWRPRMHSCRRRAWLTSAAGLFPSRGQVLASAASCSMTPSPFPDWYPIQMLCQRRVGQKGARPSICTLILLRYTPPSKKPGGGRAKATLPRMPQAYSNKPCRLTNALFTGPEHAFIGRRLPVNARSGETLAPAVTRNSIGEMVEDRGPLFTCSKSAPAQGSSREMSRWRTVIRD